MTNVGCTLAELIIEQNLCMPSRRPVEPVGFGSKPIATLGCVRLRPKNLCILSHERASYPRVATSRRQRSDPVDSNRAERAEQAVRPVFAGFGCLVVVTADLGRPILHVQHHLRSQHCSNWIVPATPDLGSVTDLSPSDASSCSANGSTILPTLFHSSNCSKLFRTGGVSHAVGIIPRGSTPAYGPICRLSLAP